MIFKPHPLSAPLPASELEEDKKHCKKFGPCGVGEKAIYLNSFFLERRYYIPFASVQRVYKRLAMSKGGFTGKGLFATIPYLVVEYDDGKEQQCNFKFEENVDQLLSCLEQSHPEIRLHSKEGERRLREKARREAAKRVKNLSPQARESIRILEDCASYLGENPELSTELSISARKKRTYERSNPAYKWVALAIVLMGVCSLAYGVYALMTQAGMAMYFLLFGLGAIFLFSSANVLPTARNNRKAVENRLAQAVQAMEHYVKAYPEFPIPAHYAHPAVLRRMKEIIAQGRAETVPEALEVLKQDLKHLNSSVTVEQDEYDEVVAIKPMFLVYNYE
ncbi:MAG: ATPase P [Candidatus Onthomonas sp.]